MSTSHSNSGLSDAVKIQIASEAGQGLHHYLVESSVVMFDEDPRKNELSSGTLVTIEGRVFVATAAHNIPQNPAGSLQILPDKPRPKSIGILRPGLSGKNHQYDVGFLELCPNAVAEYFPRKRCCSLDQISIEGTGDPKQLMVLVGSPGQFVSYAKAESDPPFVAKQIAITTTVLDQTEWPLHLNGKAVDSNSDVLLNYTQTGWINLETGEPIQLDTPHGFSGGGLWLAKIQPSVIWSPDASKLFAIDIEWDSDLRVVKATQIIHWLNLMRTRVPELRTHLEAKFPQLTAMPLMA
jgi:hypothetical protein